VHVHPRAGKKFRGQIYKGKLSVHPQADSAPPEAEQESIFRELGDLGSRRGYFGSFSVCFEGDD